MFYWLFPTCLCCVWDDWLSSKATKKSKTPTPKVLGAADTKLKSEKRTGKKQSCYHLDQQTLLHVALPVLGVRVLCCPQSPLPFALLLQAHCREQVCKQWCYRAWGSAIAHCLMELWVLLRQGTLLMVMEYLIRWQTVANTELWVLTGRQLPREKWGAQVGACGWG